MDTLFLVLRRTGPIDSVFFEMYKLKGING